MAYVERKNGTYERKALAANVILLHVTPFKKAMASNYMHKPKKTN